MAADETAARWSTVTDCVNTSLSMRVEVATSLLESANPWSYLVSSSSHTRTSCVRSMLSTCSEVLQDDDEDAIADWFFLTASALMYMHQSSPVVLNELSAVLRILRKVGPYMTLLPVALSSSWFILTHAESESMLEALETSVHGREYVWEGLLRAFNQTSNLGEGHVVALGHLMSLLLTRDSPLIYPNDFHVFVDIVVREATDLEMNDPRRTTLANVLRSGVVSPMYARSGRYRAIDVAQAVAEWKNELAREEGAMDTLVSSTWKALCDAEVVLEQT